MLNASGVVAVLVAGLILAGCTNPPTTTGSEAPTSSQPTSTPSPASPSGVPAPPWDLTVPADPFPIFGDANNWTRGGELGEAWRVRKEAGPNGFVVVWQRSTTQADKQGAVCGVAFGTETDLDITNHQIRTKHTKALLPLDEARALFSVASIDNTSGCAGKVHYVSRDGASWAVRDQPSGLAPGLVDADGTVHLGGGLTLTPGQSAWKRIDYTTNSTSTGPVRTTGTSVVLNLGFWDADAVQYDAPVCVDNFEGLNCLGVGTGP